MRTIVAVTLLSLLLAGCQSRADSEAQRAAEDADACKSHGFIAGTDAFALCLQDRDDQRRALAARANQPQTMSCATIGAQVICKPP